jgi:6-phosphogluconate dehydrogenase
MDSKIGLIGLGVMGTNVARNIADKGHKISVYNRTTETMKEVVDEHGSDNFVGFEGLEEFVESLEKPRKVLIMVKAGKPVDMVIESLIPLLDKDDVIVDLGNEHYKLTNERAEKLEAKGLHFVGCGVSGGEEGALKGPSMMPGGTKHSWDQLKKIFESIAAKDFDGGPCVFHVGEKGAGHYVKMVHNGIEYGVMQVMAEAYHLLKDIYGLDAGSISEIFKQYNDGKLKSYLFEIAVEVLAKKEDDSYVVDVILDKAAQKGTGKWTGIDSLDRGVGLSTITEAVYGRVMSSFKDLRTELSKNREKIKIEKDLALNDFILALEDALYCGMLISYSQGYHLIKIASDEEGWNIDLAEVSRIWEGGCIIRADILKELHEALADNKTEHLFEIDKIIEPIKDNLEALRTIVTLGVSNGIPLPGLSTALSYYDSMTSERLPANFIQGLRDYFGAHTYERVDKEGSFHTNW